LKINEELWYFFSDSIKKGETIMIKKIRLLSVVLLCVVEIQARWILISIQNKSDLVLLQAAHHHDVEIQSLSSKIKEQSSFDRIMLEVDDNFGSVGSCKIIGINSAGEKISISFFGDPTHKVANGRAVFADSSSRQIASNIKTSMLARVFLITPQGVQLIGSSGYEVDNQPMNLILTGSLGDYQATLVY